jgi:ATP-binding cassette subfamily F protein uup
MAAPLLSLRDIRLTFGGTPLLMGADLVVGEGDRIGLVGRNGSGKSTLLKIAAGLIEADQGERVARGGVTVRYLPQEPDLAAYPTTRAYVEAGLAPGDDLYRAVYLLNELGLSGEEVPATLSGGEGRRAALARTLAPSPDILLLDEPTNHLDLPVIEWLETELKSLRSALVLISHDRRFLENLTRTTIWLDRGQSRRMDKGFAHFEAWRDEVIEQEERDLAKLDAQIRNEEHWVRYGVSARRKRNVRRMRELGDLRQTRREARRVQGDVRLNLGETEQSSQLVIKAVKIAKAYGERVIVDDFSIRVQRGDRIGLVGANGAGKTTLINLLTGRLTPDQGTVKLGASLSMVTLDQKRDDLDPTVSLADAMTDGRGDMIEVGGEKRHVISYMKDFLFSPEQARTPVGVLSGGERARIMLARALAKSSNVMVLDEPTNDLDLETLDLLQEMLADYPGTALVVSHDRDFLDRVCTSVLVSEGAGRWVEYAGGYADMVAQRGAGVSARAIERTSAGEVSESARPVAVPAAPRPDAKRRMSPKEQHALKTLPALIDKLTADMARLQKLVDDPAAYSRDPAAFARNTKTLGDLHEQLAAAEDEWLRLEMLREDVEGG